MKSARFAGGGRPAVPAAWASTARALVSREAVVRIAVASCHSALANGLHRRAGVVRALDDVAETNAQLADAETRGEAVEVIVVLRGHVRKLPGSDGRWRIRSRDDHVVTFPADAVIASNRATRGEPRAR